MSGILHLFFYFFVAVLPNLSFLLNCLCLPPTYCFSAYFVTELIKTQFTTFNKHYSFYRLDSVCSLGPILNLSVGGISMNITFLILYVPEENDRWETMKNIKVMMDYRKIRLLLLHRDERWNSFYICLYCACKKKNLWGKLSGIRSMLPAC